MNWRLVIGIIIGVIILALAFCMVSDLIMGNRESAEHFFECIIATLFGAGITVSWPFRKKA